MAVETKEEILSIKIDTEYCNRKILLLSLSGILNTFSSVKLVKSIPQEFYDETPNFVFNFEKLNFVDSMGLSSLVTIFKKLEKKQGTICMINVKESIRTVFEITRIIEKIPIFSSIEEYIQKLENN